jgi:carbamoyl-phosphate synthase small subunit
MPPKKKPAPAKALPRKSFGDWPAPRVTGLLILADGTVLEGRGIGAEGDAVGEVCFNTAITGYQEILTDPSYAGQIVTFTFPHIGNVGTNDADLETTNLAAGAAVKGCIVKADVTEPANYRSAKHFDAWLKARRVIGLSGLDTRALTNRIREKGMPNGVIAHNARGAFDMKKLTAMAKAWSGLEGMDLARDVTHTQRMDWDELTWDWEMGYARSLGGAYKIVAIDYGLKRNILRCLTAAGCDVTVVPATAAAEDILAMNPDGVFLSNGPGDPAATGEYAVPEIRKLIDSGKPIFGICLGHQMLGIALGAKTMKMHQGHHGANHPVKDRTTGKVEITSMNHGFAVDRATLPDTVTETHVSLFDGSNAGLAVTGKPIFSVQYHPEASPGPQDSHYLFARFVGEMAKAKG